eukprot:gene8839-9786_t
MSGSDRNGSWNKQINYDKRAEEAASLREILAKYEAEKSVRRESYTATLEAQYRGQIDTISAHLQIARKYILQAKEKVVREESIVKMKQEVLSSKNKEINDINLERYLNKQVVSKNLLFLKQLVLQGSQRYAVVRKHFMEEKIQLFDVYSGLKSKADALAEDLNILKDGGQHLIVHEKALQDDQERLSKEEQDSKIYMNHLVDEIARYKKRILENRVKLQHQKAKIFQLEKENFEEQEKIDLLKVPKSPRQRSLVRRIVSFISLSLKFSQYLNEYKKRTRFF